MWYVIFVFIVSVIFYLYIYSVNRYRYWTEKGVKHDRPLFLFGNNLKCFLLRKNVSQLAEEMYWKYPNEKVVGFYRGWRRELVIRDPEIVKRVLITDFDYFYARGLVRNKSAIEPLMRNLLFADGDIWRLLRQRLTPAFTSGKLKAMFPLIVERAERLQERLRTIGGTSTDSKDLMARYTTDFIGACGFGVDSNSLNDDDSAFWKLTGLIFKVNVRQVVVMILKELFPKLTARIKFLPQMEKEIREFSSEIIHQRGGKPCGRHDFVDLLLECKEKGTIVGDSIEKKRSDGSPERTTLVIDDDLIAAQLFIFFVAGYETSSSVTSYTLHQLAYHPDSQKKAQEDIDRALAEHGGMNYEAVKDMSYLESCLKESMRMFPPAGFLIRECTNKYTIPESNLTIDPDVAVVISIQALHNDPLYFPEPEKFRPERFQSDERDPINKYVYLPFGEGPRACIGARLGLMQSLAGLAAVLSKFTVEPAPESIRNPVPDTKPGLVQSIKGGLPLIFKPRYPMKCV